jgi:hypothetical protein
MCTGAGGGGRAKERSRGGESLGRSTGQQEALRARHDSRWFDGMSLCWGSLSMLGHCRLEGGDRRRCTLGVFCWTINLERVPHGRDGIVIAVKKNIFVASYMYCILDRTSFSRHF